ncbi:DUF927 domain-containing protein [Buttiauxella noackiae]|uniref:DUF927 domain-containing protein n=1 Tax=Buttiauxella noackiae TaxID=82992 RepID=UPI0028D34DB4|nr:DUF927 domain-containing protein [Buttiauxella noackiae]
MRNIDLIREVTNAAANQWHSVLTGLNIDVPDSPRKHTACPACGGNDRFRFDDNGRGSHFCNVCGAGDGLDLIRKVNSCDTTEAAKLAADVLGIDYRDAETSLQDASQRQNQLEAERQQREQERDQKVAEDAVKRRNAFTTRYQALAEKAVPGESEYLKAKELRGFTFPVLPDGSLLLTLVDDSGDVTAAQTITPQGEKRLVIGSTKRGAYHAVNAPEAPQTVLIAEGLATALSAHLMCPDALAVAAIDAGNLLPVAELMRKKYPGDKIVLIADNDQQTGGSEIGGTNIGKEAAEKAALSVAGWVSLPPTDDKADWDDYRQQNGLEAATQAFNESMYQPQGKAVKPQLQAIEDGKITARENDPLKPRIESRKDGVFWVTPKVDKESGEIISNEAWLSSPFSIIGEGTDQDADKSYTAIRWQHHGQTVTRLIEGGAVGDRDGWRVMKDGGLKVTTKTNLRAILSDWMQIQSTKAPRMKITPRAGWYDGVYIMPDGEVIGESETPVMFNGGSAAAGAYTIAGTVESWRNNVAALAAGNPFMMLGVASALAAPMVSLVGADGFGIHLFAGSTAGKTTTADLATSLYGMPERQRLTWYGTALGIANEAEAHNDGLLSLDEIGQGTRARDVYTSAYTLFNGKGKLQGDKDGGNKVLKHWKTVAISTGEISVETFLSAEGIKVKAGQLARLLNVPITRATELHGYQNGKQHADALKMAWAEHHGAAGREWIRYLSSHKQQAKEAYQAAKDRWASVIPQSYGEQVHRVSDRFAVMEAALVVGGFITGWGEQESRDAIQHAFNAWIAVFGTGNKDHQQIIEQCEAFLNAHGLSRFAPFPYSPADMPIRDLAGYRQKGEHEDSPMIFYTFPAAFEDEIARGITVSQAAEVLKNAGMLIPPTSDRGYKRKSPRIDGRQIRVYVLKFLPEDEDSQPEE